MLKRVIDKFIFVKTVLMKYSYSEEGVIKWFIGVRTVL